MGEGVGWFGVGSELGFEGGRGFEGESGGGVCFGRHCVDCLVDAMDLGGSVLKFEGEEGRRRKWETMLQRHCLS